jgi:hypothetical protein
MPMYLHDKVFGTLHATRLGTLLNKYKQIQYYLPKIMGNHDITV